VCLIHFKKRHKRYLSIFVVKLFNKFIHKKNDFNPNTTCMIKDEIYSDSYIKALFNKISESYDFVNNFVNFRLPILIRKNHLNTLEASNEAYKILDLMSGLGENWEVLSKRYPNAQITAIDISEKMCQLSNKKGIKYFGNNIKIINADIFKTELESQYYDLIICSFGLKCMSLNQIDLLAKLLKGAVKNGGKFHFLEVSKPSNLMVNKLISVHFKYYLPFIAWAFHKKHNEYKMLWKYMENFDIYSIMSIFDKHKLNIHFKQSLYGTVIILQN
jgi:ubiquinone/menaquinone biosynthesis C-methylase UbiE